MLVRIHILFAGKVSLKQMVRKFSFLRYLWIMSSKFLHIENKLLNYFISWMSITDVKPAL